MKKTLPYFNDQILSYAEFGDPHGEAVLVQHGMIASVDDGALFHRLTEAGKRVICAARPGYGDSSPYAMEKIGDWGEIITVLVDALGSDHFDVLGISSGAPYAYAVAARLPQRTRRVWILSGIPALYDAGVQALWPHPLNPQASLAEMRAVAKEVFFGYLSPAELANPDTLDDDTRDSLRNDGFGPALDLQIRGRDWGFTLADVHAPVWMRHSRADMPALAQRTAQLLPDCRLDLRENDPHFSPAVLDDFLGSLIY